MTPIWRFEFVSRILKLFLVRVLGFLKCDFVPRQDTGLFELLRVFICYIFFTYGRRQRFPTYDYKKKDPFNRGLLFRDEEKRHEYPAHQENLDSMGPQELLLTGIRNSGELLMIRFVRAGQRQAEITILLRDPEGRIFTTHDNEDQHFLLDISHGNKYQAGGLRMQCLEPMRKWRIAFNGLLSEKGGGASAYVRFAFLWYAMSHFSDWACDVPAKRLSEFCLDPMSKEKTSDTVASVEMCREYLNGYEQSGYCVGSMQVSVKGDESVVAEEYAQELHLRGNFLRIRHPNPSMSNSPKLNGFTHNFTYSKKGHLLQLSTLKFSNGKGIVFGSFLSTPGFKDPIESVLNEQGLEASLDDAFTSPILKFSTFELSHNLLKSEGSVLDTFRSHLVWNDAMRVSTYDALIDDIPAKGLSIQGFISGDCSERILKPPVNILDYDSIDVAPPYVVNLGDPRCKNSALTGGKGSSLAVLLELSKIDNGDDKFDVPDGVVVTTEAFRRFMQSPAMHSMRKDLMEVLNAATVEDVKVICDRCMNLVKEQFIPKSVSDQILHQIGEIFPDVSAKRFAIRSSCAGEDSEDMSAAGQMDTFLGIKGEDQILESLLRCWASQFSHVAIEYTKRYGQELVSDMAVVIMEMVPADSAGVMFTCDPLSGDPSTIYITSNFGLGESVVSALADPDTVRVSRDISGKLMVNEVEVGKKAVKIVMDKDGDGTRTEDVAETNSSSLSSSQALLLAKVGAQVERSYGDWRDVEWAFAQEKLYILQARPLTFMDKPSDLEITVDFEVPARAESSVYSRANVGEVLSGAVSPLTITMINRVVCIEITNQKSKYARMNRCALSPYYNSFTRVARYHYFFDISEALRMFVPDMSNKASVESMMLNLCGRIIDDEELYEDMGDKTDKDPDTPFWWKNYDIIKMKYFARPIFLFGRYMARKKTRHPQSNMTCEELFEGLLEANNIETDYGCYPHMNSSNGSSQWTSRIVQYLQEVTEESTETIYGDMSRLLASADDVVSCEVPNKLEQLAILIRSEIGEEKFLECSADAAERLLKDDEKYPKSTAQFRQCLKEFGHRGLNEFDIYRKTWDMDAAPVITTLQTMIRTQMSGTPKVYESIFTSIEGIKCKLTPWQKLRLAAIVYFSRKAVGVRENTKSLWIWTQNIVRKWAWALAAKMKEEGRLPQEELLFFCSPSEIDELIRSRNPTIISRAFDRKRLFPELCNQEYPEYFRGIARPAPEPLPEFEDGVVQMKGFPISKGRIQAKARVINKLEDAVQIQRGEILVTHATDIGWSPYFPMLGGVVTELGGLMSHGAVVAREYGLPCVVGLLGATKVFRSGDTVLLDGSQGLLIRIEEAP